MSTAGRWRRTLSTIVPARRCRGQDQPSMCKSDIEQKGEVIGVEAKNDSGPYKVRAHKTVIRDRAASPDPDCWNFLSISAYGGAA